MADSKKNSGLPQPEAPFFPEWEAPGASDPKLTQGEIDQLVAYLNANPLPIGQVPGFGSSSITGRIAANGQINSPPNPQFDCNRTGTGTYVVTYKQEFAVEPVVLFALTEDPDQGGAVVGGLTAHSASGFTLRWKVSGGVDQNQSFMFATILMR